MIDRYFIDKQLDAGGIVELEGTEFHHLARVMRVKIGQSIELVNGRGRLAVSKVEKLHEKRAELFILDVFQQDKPDCEIILAQALPRLKRLDVLIEKGTELGATEFWLFAGKRSEKSDLSPHQIIRQESIAVSAMKQCGRLWLPKIQIKPPLKNWESLPKSFYFGDLRKTAPLFKNIWKKGKKNGFAIGPESGFTDREIEILEHLGAQGARLSPNVLRTETASILSLGLISHWSMH